ncbi:hypothetical protein ABL78_4408 [Leptomonas seymouri]|uniref:Uncharacterized protein n=1 Tax=Leptomonas seymouri TaxID=5684 RepID=A0A0N0P5I5_LEPSE|nr:hypothetical protein ABL78_4408 [Leptomonas seymouri]|eukprot:KPI86506.1 hypothetical protein ABL78_4408 [Leptomonas seymouri]
MPLLPSFPTNCCCNDNTTSLRWRLALNAAEEVAEEDAEGVRGLRGTDVLGVGGGAEAVVELAMALAFDVTIVDAAPAVEGQERVEESA